MYTNNTILEYLKTEIKGPVGMIELHRPKALNALCSPLIIELNKTLEELDNNENIRCILLHGSKKAFAG